MKFKKDFSIFLVKVVAFATAFTVLYDLVKDLGEIAITLYHWLGILLCTSVFSSSRIFKK